MIRVYAMRALVVPTEADYPGLTEGARRELARVYHYQWAQSHTAFDLIAGGEGFYLAMQFPWAVAEIARLIQGEWGYVPTFTVWSGACHDFDPCELDDDEDADLTADMARVRVGVPS